MPDQKEFCLQSNSYGSFLCKSPMLDDPQWDQKKAQAVFVFCQIISYIKLANPCIIIHDITYHSARVHKVELFYFEKKDNVLSSMLYMEREYSLLSQLHENIAQDFSNLVDYTDDL